MLKVDLKRQYRDLYNPSPKQAEVVDVPAMNYVMIDGAGDPNTSADYTDAVSALYSVSYTLKFMLKKGPQAIDYGVMALEGLWWAGDMNHYMARKDEWLWTMMILQPEFITPDHIAAAVLEAARKKDLPALPRLRFEPFHEGLAVQIMHLGPYQDEPPTIARLHAAIAEKGYVLQGKHHEIYLSDPTRTAPERMKTILRQPVISKSQ